MKRGTWTDEPLFTQAECDELARIAHAEAVRERRRVKFAREREVQGLPEICVLQEGML